MPRLDTVAPSPITLLFPQCPIIIKSGFAFLTRAEPSSLEAAGDRQELEPVTHFKPSPSTFRVSMNFVAENPALRRWRALEAQ